MKQDINPATLIGAIGAVIALIVFLAWYFLAPGPSSGVVNTESLKASQIRKDVREDR